MGGGDEKAAAEKAEEVAKIDREIKRDHLKYQEQERQRHDREKNVKSDSKSNSDNNSSVW